MNDTHEQAGKTATPPDPSALSTPHAYSADTYSYRGWLNSDFFWKRLLAILGYNIAGTLVLYLALILVFIVFSGIAALVLTGVSFFPTF